VAIYFFATKAKALNLLSAMGFAVHQKGKIDFLLIVYMIFNGSR
jgi:hypothetical protein